MTTIEGDTPFSFSLSSLYNWRAISNNTNKYNNLLMNEEAKKKKKKKKKEDAEVERNYIHIYLLVMMSFFILLFCCVFITMITIERLKLIAISYIFSNSIASLPFHLLTNVHHETVNVLR